MLCVLYVVSYTRWYMTNTLSQLLQLVKTVQGHPYYLPKILSLTFDTKISVLWVDELKYKYSPLIKGSKEKL